MKNFKLFEKCNRRIARRVTLIAVLLAMCIPQMEANGYYLANGYWGQVDIYFNDHTTNCNVGETGDDQDWGADPVTLLTLTGFRVNVYQASENQISWSQMYYRFYKLGSTPPSYSCTYNAGWKSNNGGTNGWWEGSQHQTWELTNQDIYLVTPTTESGYYYFDFYFNTDDVGYLSNNSTQYRIYFTVANRVLATNYTADGGSSWSNTERTLSDGSYTIYNVAASTDIDFKMALSGSWYNAFGWDNVGGNTGVGNLTLKSAGSDNNIRVTTPSGYRSDVTFTYSGSTVSVSATPHVYSITYKDKDNVDFSGAHMPDYPTTHTSGTATTLKKASKAGYVFGGWYTDSGCTGSAVTSLGATAYTSNIILYAKWTAVSLTAMANNTIYKAENIVPDGLTISTTEYYRAGVSTHNMFDMLGTGTEGNKDTGGAPSPMGAKDNTSGSADATISGTSFDYSLFFKNSSARAGDAATDLPTSRAVHFKVSGTGKLDVWCKDPKNISIIKDGGSASALHASNTGNQLQTVDVTAGEYYIFATKGSTTLFGLRFRQQYAVTYSPITNATKTSGDATICHGEAFEATFTANAHYTLPSDVTVTIGDAAQTKGTGYTWTISDGVGTLSIEAAKVTGAINVSFDAVADSYTVTHTTSNVTETSCPTSATYGTDYSATYTEASGYDLPTTIGVTIGGGSATVDEDYTWSVSEGVGSLAIPGENITGNIVVTVTGVAECTAPTASWSTTPANGIVGGSMTAAVTTNYSDGLVYSVTDATPSGCVTIGSSTGAISYVKPGTATVKATVTGDGSTYCTGPTVISQAIKVHNPQVEDDTYAYYYSDETHFDGTNTYKNPEGNTPGGSDGDNTALSTTSWTVRDNTFMDGLTSIVATNARYDKKNNHINAYIKIRKTNDEQGSIVFTIAEGYTATIKIKMGGYSSTNTSLTMKLNDSGDNISYSGTMAGKATTEDSFAELTYADLAAGAYTLKPTDGSLYISQIDIETTSLDYAITKSASNGTISTKVSGSEVSSAAEDATVYITATPSTGYDFTSWTIINTSTEADVTATLLGDNSETASTSFTMPSYGVTVNATFTAIDYDITHSDAENGTYTISVAGGSATDENTTANYGQTITLAATPDSHYKLQAWNVTKTSSGDAVSMATENTFVMPAEAVTIAPTFGRVYTVSFYTHGGSSQASIEQSTVGGAITMPAAPTYASHEFVNWVIGGTTVAAGAEYTPTEDVTAHATWKANCAGGGGSTSLYKFQVKSSGITGLDALSSNTSLTTANYLSALSGGTLDAVISSAGDIVNVGDTAIQLKKDAGYLTIGLTTALQDGDIIKFRTYNNSPRLQVGTTYSALTDVLLNRNATNKIAPVTHSMAGVKTLYLRRPGQNTHFTYFEIIRPSQVLVYTEIKNDLSDANIGTSTLTALTTSDKLSVLTGATMEYADPNNSAGDVQIKDKEFMLNHNNAYVKFTLTGGNKLAQGDMIVINSSTNASSREFYIAKASDGTKYSTTSQVYTIPAESPLIGSTTLFVWRYSGSATNIKTFTIVRPGSGGGDCYYITYDGNGADAGSVNDDRAYSSGDNVYVSTCDLSSNFTREGYEFNGWNNKPDGSGTYYNYWTNSDKVVITKDTTLYAQWKIVVDEDNENLSGFETPQHKDVVVRNGAKLTITQNMSVRNITVESGSTLHVAKNGEEGITLSIDSLSLVGGYYMKKDYSQVYDMPRVYIDPLSTLSRTNSTINFDIAVTNQYHPIAVPFPVKVSDVKYTNESLRAITTYGTHYLIKTYDGAARANGSYACWTFVSNIKYNEDTEDYEDTYLQPGRGYILAAIRGKGDPYAFIRFPMKNVDDEWTTLGEQGTVDDVTKNVVAVEAYLKDGDTDGTKTPNANKGWNILGVPFMSRYQATDDIIQSPMEIIQGHFDYSTNKWDDDEIRYVTVPTYDFSEYNQYSIEDEGTILLPGWCFFVQVETSGNLKFLSASEAENEAMPIYAPKREQERKPTVKTGIILTGANAKDKTTIIVSDKYSAAEYEINADLEKMFGENGYTLATYTLSGETRLAYNAMNNADIMDVIPVGYRAPEEGEYTFSINPRYAESEAFEQVNLIDYEEGVITNLLQSSYSFTTARTQNDARFAINVVKRQDMPTDVENVQGGDAESNKVRKVIINDKMYIILDGKMYDATGKMLK